MLVVRRDDQPHIAHAERLGKRVLDQRRADVQRCNSRCVTVSE